ncbi:MAG: glycogen synthase GlgA [Melioribacteraceae bacterium]|nr:glycogen synthase GlgA [Melioribacteraceae bacterium]MCF8354395.1 glycogen synthase GlgA [Melioribacteraceae bacterium]MCF8393008.1 glycogen synthase GlgA [Melioribacteraceae bacterium]MCF8417249.1 glycogen synthase GlgA [Melioribacteraceae bacterium]
MPPSKKLKILFVTSEVVPFIKTGGLADVSSALPQKLQEQGHQVRIVVPKYGAIDERKYKIHEVVRLKDLTTTIGKKEVVFSLRSSFLVGQKARVQLYFLDNEEYFGSRHSLYADPLTGKDFPDNDERFILLARSVFELIIKLGWVPDVIHCNDWQCGLVPAYLKTLFKDTPLFQPVKTLFTIHNLSYQGEFPKTTFAKTGLPDELNNTKGIIHNNKVNYLKAALNFADVINTVSETYANEICKDKEISGGLNTVLCKRQDDLFGIVNGIDSLIWNPEKDKKIAKKYSIKSLDDKTENKIALAEKFGFDYKENVPVIGLISRLYDSKGLDLIQKAFKDLMKLDIRLVLLGTGEKKFHKFFEEALMKYSDKFSCYLGFDDELAHLIEAGADMYLMPSKYEPCGLNQMYSLVYGTVPIVRETGGLADTVENFDEKEQTGNGFVFKKYDQKDMIKEIKRAIKIYTNDKKTWQKIQKSGMKSNFTWMNSAKNYVDLYKTILS